MFRMFHRPRYLPPAVEHRGALHVDALFALFCFVTIWLGVAFGSPIRYLTYLIPVLGVAFAMAMGGIHMPDIYRPMLVLVVGGIATAPLATLWGWQDLYLVLIGIMPFCLGYRPRLTWWQVFWGFVIGTVLGLAVVQLFGRSPLEGGVQFNPLLSQSSFESPYGHAFGVLAVWAAVTRRWKHFLLALVLAILTLKRIAVIATVVCGLVYLMPRGLVDRVLRPWFMIPANVLLLSLAILYGLGYFDRWVYETFGTSSNHVSMGRRWLYHWPARDIVDSMPGLLFIGDGAGHVYQVLMQKAGYSGKYQLHSDLMKLLLEYGGLVFFLYFWFAYRFKSLAARMFWLYFNIIMLTDNALNYQYLVFVLGLCSMCARRELGDTEGMMSSLYTSNATVGAQLNRPPIRNANSP
ncbi:hypothetical protein C1702_02840 [Caldimonas thermodepolymerans]|uniref:Uncharacterized protein n=2 Tax=Caldimonas thermodepolymerans TaxID=215580 RepID=A0A2S5T8R0_9BURK|nr:hypothetical protein C1702_02840 [Caldimonas thermodepolymerans]